MIGCRENEPSDAGDRGCQFGLCPREAELEVTLGENIAPLLVCGLHVTPVLTWGVPDQVAEPVIRVLTQRHGEVA